MFEDPNAAAPIADMPIDGVYVWAVLSFGLGLSLATYHWFARRSNWSMGEVQANHVWAAIVLGALSMMPAIWYAAERWEFFDRWNIPLVGLAMGMLFTALLRMYAQISLFLAPGFSTGAVLYVVNEMVNNERSQT